MLFLSEWQLCLVRNICAAFTNIAKSESKIIKLA